MSTVGEQLRQTREAQNLTVYQVAEVTKIRTDHIRALEEGNYDVFSAPVYVRGFVRAYAGLLKLEVPPLVQQLNQELAKSDKHHEPPPLTKAQRTILDVLMYQLSKLNWRVVLPALVVVLVAVGGWMIYRSFSQSQTPPTQNAAPRLSPGIYQPAQRSGHTLPVPQPARR